MSDCACSCGLTASQFRAQGPSPSNPPRSLCDVNLDLTSKSSPGQYGMLLPADAAEADMTCCNLGDHPSVCAFASCPNCSILGHKFLRRSLAQIRVFPVAVRMAPFQVSCSCQVTWQTTEHPTTMKHQGTPIHAGAMHVCKQGRPQEMRICGRRAAQQLFMTCCTMHQTFGSASKADALVLQNVVVQHILHDAHLMGSDNHVKIQPCLFPFSASNNIHRTPTLVLARILHIFAEVFKSSVILTAAPILSTGSQAPASGL